MVESSLGLAASLRRGRIARWRVRRGLAPLEFVLWLPVLLFVAALMVNFGTMATWRVRGEVVSRHAVWRGRWPRSGRQEARPPNWPRDATLARRPAEPFLVLDDPAIDHPVVRGPLPNRFVVTAVLDPAGPGAWEGVSAVERRDPLLPRLGRYESGEIRSPLLDYHWQAAQQGIGNLSRRIKRLYELPTTEAALPLAFARAVQGIFLIPHYTALAVLDRDSDVRKYTGRFRDFHPRIAPDLCELEREIVYRQRVVPLVDTRGATDIRLGRISRLPRSLTVFFLDMYRAAVRRLEAELNQIPPPPPARQAEILRELADLRKKVEQLEAYQERLDSLEDDMRARADAVLP